MQRHTHLNLISIVGLLLIAVAAQAQEKKPVEPQKIVEQGIAIERDIPIVTIGKRGEHSNNVFPYLSNYRWVETLPEAIKVIADLEWGMYYGREHERARDASTRGR